MLYLIHGNDGARSREKLHVLLDGFFLIRPDASYFYITPEIFNIDALHELTLSRGLFEQDHIVVFDQVLEDDASKNATVKNLQELRGAPHAFVFFEKSIDKETLSRFGKYAEKIYEFSKKEIKTTRFDPFSLTDALGLRDSKKLWMLYQRARHAGISDEEIHGLFFWQIKTMLLAKTAKTAEEAGLKPFPFKKSLTFLKNYSEEEIHNISRVLLVLPHEARRGTYEFGIALEHFILSI